MRFFVTTVALILVPPVALSAEPARAAIDELVKAFLKDKPHLGLVVGVTQPSGHQVFGYGKVTLQGKKQVPDAATLFEIGSITKVFTGTLLADQILCGAVRLDDPVQKYLPEDLVVPRRDDRDISLLHLATHTSSLPKEPPFMAVFALTTKDRANPYAQYNEVNLRRTLAGLKLTRPIGGRYD
jgi:CubicO group peptidase (beta-lactamase class C family)